MDWSESYSWWGMLPSSLGREKKDDISWGNWALDSPGHGGGLVAIAGSFVGEVVGGAFQGGLG